MNIEEYLLVPYKEHGRSMEEGFDCYGLIRHLIYDKFGISLPDPEYNIDEKKVAEILAEYDLSSWVIKVDIEDIQPYDLVLIRNFAGTIAGHIGIYVGNGIVLHASKPRISAHKLSNLKKLIIGCYRLKHDHS